MPSKLFGKQSYLGGLVIWKIVIESPEILNLTPIK